MVRAVAPEDREWRFWPGPAVALLLSVTELIIAAVVGVTTRSIWWTALVAFGFAVVDLMIIAPVAFFVGSRCPRVHRG